MLKEKWFRGLQWREAPRLVEGRYLHLMDHVLAVGLVLWSVHPGEARRQARANRHLLRKERLAHL